MRKLLIILSVIFAVTGIIFTILPMGTIAFLPVVIAVICSVLAIIKSDPAKKKFPKMLLLSSIVIFLAAIAKDVLFKDKVVVDQQFIQEKQESKQEAQKELEELEGL